MTVDRKLLEVLVCPSCKGPLVEVREASQDGGALAVGAAATPAGESTLVALDCRACRLRYSVVDDIPVMLVDQAKRIPA